MPLCLNVGSGQRPFKSVGEYQWVNIDINPKWQPDIVADASKLEMFADNSVDLIVSHHQAEHLTLGESQAMFQECCRVLHPSGRMLVFVPDLFQLVRAWTQGRISDYIFCVNLHGAFMDDLADIHKWSFTRKTLAEHITKSGNWAWIRPFEWDEIPGANLAKDWWVLGVEAVKQK